MRVAVFIKSTTFHHGFGGMEIQNKNLCEGLVRLGHQVVVYSPFYGREEEILENEVSYKFLDCKYKNQGFVESLLHPNTKKQWYKKSLERFYKDSSNVKFDIAVSQSSAGLGIIRGKTSLKIPVVSICHGSILSEFKTLLTRPKNALTVLRLLKDLEYVVRTYLTTQKEFVLGSDAVVAVSEFVKKSIVSETGVQTDKVLVIHNGVVPSEAPAKKSLGVEILYVGRLEQDKGLRELLDVFGSLKEKFSDLRLVLVGDGPFKDVLQDRIRQLNLLSSVKLTGRVSPGEVPSYLGSADIFVIPTKRVEGFPMTIPEAMFARLPIVATDLGGISEGVVDGGTGYLVRSSDWEGFEEKVRLLVQNEGLRSRMGDAARLRADEKFSCDAMVGSYVKLFERLL